MHICDNISVNYYQNEKFFRQVVEKVKIHFIINKFFSESQAVYDIMWKTVVQPDRTDDNPAYALGMLDNKAYKDILVI
jgi:hypothetical protein